MEVPGLVLPHHPTSTAAGMAESRSLLETKSANDPKSFFSHAAGWAGMSKRDSSDASQVPTSRSEKGREDGSSCLLCLRLLQQKSLLAQQQVWRGLNSAGLLGFGWRWQGSDV